LSVASVGETLYWNSYHAYFASLGDAEHRGHQIGAREAIASFAAIVGPLVGGWALATLDARIAFGARRLSTSIGRFSARCADRTCIRKSQKNTVRVDTM
jgi:hypothetical protein